MTTIYKQSILRSQNILQRLLKQLPKENAIIEINNLLAEKEIMDISIDDINNIAIKYKINIVKEFERNLLEFYAAYLKYCYEDFHLADEEIENLRHLKVLLNLSESKITEIHNKIKAQIYERKYKEAISDGQISEAEKQMLDNLQNELRLPEEIENRITDNARRNYMDNFITKIVADERISPEEIQEMETIAKNLNISINIDSKSRALFEKYKLYWVLENGVLPQLTVDINLQKDEKCYFMSKANWYEYRTVTRRINYGGPTARIKIMKGVYYRIGSVGVNRVTSNELKLINTGVLYLTNKRLIFSGTEKNSIIKLDKILSFTPYSNGVEIDKESGKSPTIMFNENIEMFCIILSRLLKES